MATNKRTYPNTYFTWYNDDNRIAILTEDTTTTSGERTKEKYDTFQGDGNLSGTITTFANYTSTVSGTTKATCSASHGLITGDRITISSEPDSYYDGNYSITKIDDDEFYFTKAYSAEDSGTFTSLFIDNGLRITYHAKYEEATATTDNLQSGLGLDSALHNAVLCYVKARLYEDDEDLEYAAYYRRMYEQKVKKFRGRRSAVRHLAVTRL
tara:strand:+ start:2431 stop:3063 length:633 start_codon:yes stop_codon:yes gene_type:complete